jgi:hypothetical protein
MPGRKRCKELSCWQSTGIATNLTEALMGKAQFDELAGRIDGVAHALLRLTAELEMQELIDAPQVSQAWREARPEHLATEHMLQASRHVLHQMADQLDGARGVRQSRGQTR